MLLYNENKRKKSVLQSLSLGMSILKKIKYQRISNIRTATNKLCKILSA